MGNAFALLSHAWEAWRPLDGIYTKETLMADEYPVARALTEHWRVVEIDDG